MTMPRNTLHTDDAFLSEEITLALTVNSFNSLGIVPSITVSLRACLEAVRAVPTDITLNRNNVARYFPRICPVT